MVALQQSRTFNRYYTFMYNRLGPEQALFFLHRTDTIELGMHKTTSISFGLLHYLHTLANTTCSTPPNRPTLFLSILPKVS